MKISPINNTDNSFKASFAPTKEFVKYKKSLQKEGKIWAEKFYSTYDNFTKNGDNNVYSFVYEVEDIFMSEYKRFGVALNAVIKDDKKNKLDSIQMDRQLYKKHLKPKIQAQVLLLERFMENATAKMNSSDNKLNWDIIMKVANRRRPYNTDDFKKESFIPDI